jgi:hypothetical protein
MWTMTMHHAQARVAFNGIAKGHRFDYDDETDQNILGLIEGGYVEDLGPHVVDDGTPGQEENDTVPVSSPRRTKTKTGDVIMAAEPAE